MQEIYLMSKCDSDKSTSEVRSNSPTRLQVNNTWLKPQLSQQYMTQIITKSIKNVLNTNSTSIYNISEAIRICPFLYH